MNELSTYDYIVSVLRDEDRILTEALTSGKILDDDPLDRLRARVSKELLLQALTDSRLDTEDADSLKETLRALYNYELTSQ